MATTVRDQEETKLAEYLIRRVCDRAIGRDEDECLRNYPRDVYFIGSLRPRGEDTEDSGMPAYLRELLSKLAPVAYGADFRVKPDAAEVHISVEMQWACYYRVFPSLTQQREQIQILEEL